MPSNKEGSTIKLMLQIASRCTEIGYRHIAKPLVFKIDPEKVHDSTLNIASIFGKAKPISYTIEKLYSYQNKSLEQNIDGVYYKNPIGLAAGWDKDAKAIKIMNYLGFGFTEVGSITKCAYPGNEGTRLWRLPNSKSILVYYGLKNMGVDYINSEILKSVSKIPVGTNIARTNSPNCDDISSIEDYAYSFNTLSKTGDYFTINISCPNTFGGQPFHDKYRLNKLLTRLDKIKTKKPVYIKLSPDISQNERKEIAELSFSHNVQGFICGNLTKNRDLKTIYDDDISKVGGMSGKVVEELSNRLIKDMYRLTNGKKTIIGLGGVFNSEDAYAKIKLGASLVQMLTGLIYCGPQTIGQVNKGLHESLTKDGFSSISEAIGINNNTP